MRQKVLPWYNNISPLSSPFPLGFVSHEYRGELFLRDLFVDTFWGVKFTILDSLDVGS